MKKALFILGFLFIIIIIAIVTGISYIAITGNKLDAESKIFVKKVMDTIVNDWSEKEFIKNVGPELANKVSKNSLRMTFGRFRALGKVQTYSEPKGESNMSIIIGKNKSITAFYIVETTFENALATIKITLKKYNNDWKIIGFHVVLEKGRTR